IARGRRGQGRGVRLLHQQGRAVPGRLPGRGALVQQLPGGAAGGARAGLLRGHRVLAPAHAAPDPRGLGPLPGDAGRQLLLQPAAAARDHPVPAARGPVRHPGVRAVRRRARRDPPRHRRQDGCVAGGLADGPLPGRDRDRGAGPGAVRRGGRVTADAGRARPAVRGAAAQRHRGGFRVRCRAAGMTTGQRPGAGEQGTAGAQVAGRQDGAQVAGGLHGAHVAGGQHMAVREARIPMRDGIELAATLYLPAQPAGPVPALLEYLPYRKDDAMLARDYELYAYLATHGYAGARVDIRGTGSSDGDLPEGEYTEQEQLDAEDVIAWLAAQPWSTGAVGMWGISWGGFNAIQVALRRPPALRSEEHTSELQSLA